MLQDRAQVVLISTSAHEVVTISYLWPTRHISTGFNTVLFAKFGSRHCPLSYPSAYNRKQCNCFMAIYNHSLPRKLTHMKSRGVVSARHISAFP